MSLSPVNNPPAPVQEQVNPAIPTPEDCAALKAEFGIEVGSHSENESKKSRTYQSHHILQNEAVQPAGLISYGDGLAVLLGNSHRGTEHQTITKRQNERRDNKRFGRAGTMPAANVGELKKQAQEDLVAAMEGKRTSNRTGKPMSKEEAEKAAACLVNDAENKLKKEAKKKGKKVNDRTPVTQPGGCLAPGTLVWLADGSACAVEDIAPGDEIATLSGASIVVRNDLCHHDLVAIRIGASVTTLASFHRLVLAAGGSLRADQVRAGEVLATRFGAAQVHSVESLGARRWPVHRLTLRERDACAVGEGGVWCLLPAGGPPVTRRDSVAPFAEEGRPCLP
jgi:hypothetical protein